MAKSILLLLLFLFVVPFAIADYTDLGNSDHDFREGEGSWNPQIDTDLVTQNTRAISSQRAYPVVGDMDGDGTNEIAYVNGATLLIMQGKELTVVGSDSVGSDERITNVLMYDIDNDGFLEVVYGQEQTKQIVIGNWNGSTLTTSTIGMSITHTDGEMVIGCKASNDCLLSYIEADDSTNNVRIVRAKGFNSTEFYTNELTVESTTGSGVGGREGAYCFPKLKYIDTQDDVFALGFGLFKNTNQGGGGYRAYEITRSGSTISANSEFTLAFAYFNIPSASFNCETDLLGNRLTALTKEDVLSTESGKEYLFASNIGASAFKVYSYKSDGSFIDDHPEVGDANGNIMSNIIIMEGDEDGTGEEFCVVGYSQTDDELNLVCSTEETTGFTETKEYEYTGINSIFNVTTSYGTYNVVAHAMETVTNDYDELVSPYGVFSINPALPRTLELEYDIPIDDGVVIPVDYQNVGLDDFLILTDTNLFYLDDGFTNTGGQITQYTINPCIDSIWQINTTVNVQVEVTDINADQVGARVALYADESGEIDNGWSFNASSGTTFNFNFVANQTTGSSILRMLGRDVVDPAVEDEIEVSYTVGTQGVEQGDCSTTVTIGVDEDVDTIGEQLGVAEDNAITSAIEQIDTDVGMGLGSTTIWIIFMIGLAWMVFRNEAISGSTKVGMTIVIEFFMLVLGTILGFFSTALVVIISIPVIAIVAVIGAKFFLGSRQ